MSRYTWTLIKNGKNFNVSIYRRGLVLLILSLLFSLLLSIFLFYFYLREPERDYYATSGVTPPIKLKSMMTPNMSSVPLLEPDPSTDDDFRVIPQ